VVAQNGISNLKEGPDLGRLIPNVSMTWNGCQKILMEACC